MLHIINYLKATYYANNTFPGIWGVILGLFCSHTHTNFEKSLYMIFWVTYAFLEVPRLQLPNERVSFGTPSYVGRGHIWILPPTSRPPSNQSIANILWNSRRALGGDVRAFKKQGYSIQKWMSNLSVCHVTAWQGVRRNCRTAAEALAAVRQLWRGRFGGSPAAPVGGTWRQSGSSSRGSSVAVRQLSSGSTIPFSSMSRFNMDFRESRPKFLSPIPSQPWPR
jgi:hypothetical protein